MRLLFFPLAAGIACLAAACTSSSSSNCTLTIDAECGGDAGFACPMTLSAVPSCGGMTLSCGSYAGFAEGSADGHRITLYYDMQTGALAGILDDDTLESVVTTACNSGSFAPPVCTTLATLPACAAGADGGVPADSGSE
jgi:hypothetical protein